MALNGYSEKEPFKGDGADVPTSTVVSQRSSGADSRHSRFSVKPVGSSANTFEPASGLLSIVIPTLNAEDEIHGCLSSSLFVPTAKGLIKEVIVSDGGSTDQTKLIAESMGRIGLTRQLDVVLNSPREQKLQRVSGCCCCTPILG